jgi:hypothetical protein
MEDHLAALDRIATNRFLWAGILNGLQQTTCDQVQVTRIKAEQFYVAIEAVAPKSNGLKRIPGQPAASIERASLCLEAKDSNPAEQTYNKYKESLSNSEYFLKRLQRRDGFILGTLGAPQVDTQGRQSVNFTLESHFPEVRRSE